ncbi:unnamed protein product [Spirodela intermedia]|uniref:Uncharacterized protein n=2 Tax=Spirodela intermedia TaxID=51605 RepID=A0A7I8IJJ6_SPIIN|nr:unnamed protein product [Spirodela intermedia]CAA6658056.1 unnamed protein product [Spirodela intermedia]CAA7394192.1 unnamed protein product [Spirodela intermedia]
MGGGIHISPYEASWRRMTLTLRGLFLNAQQLESAAGLPGSDNRRS